jgi:hypothetical protein
MAKAIPIDEHQLRALHQEGLSLPAIARRLHTSKAAVGSRVKALGLDRDAPESPARPPAVDRAPAEALPDELAELRQWWRDRQAALHEASDASRQTERTTYHIERRWVEAIRRQSDLDDWTYTQVVNEAFRQYFEGLSTRGGPAVDVPGAPGPDAPLMVRALATLEAATEQVKAELRAAEPRPEAADDLEDMDLDPAPPAKAKRGRRAP